MRFFPPKLRLSVLLASILAFTACATVAPPQPPSLELPKPPSDLRAVRKGESVTLTWTIPTFTTDRQAARSLGPTHICRSVAMKMTECAVVGEASPEQKPGATLTKKTPTSYTDKLPPELESDSPASYATYAVEVLNAGGRGAGLSNQARVSLARTLPPPQGVSAQVTNTGVTLTWASDVPAEASGLRYVYRISRRAEGSAQWMLVGEMTSGGEHSLVDSGIEWEKTYEYRADTVTILQGEKAEIRIEGDDSPEIKVFAHDVLPPATPSGLQAAFSGPGQKAFIDLIWAPVTDVDLDGYNIYRHEDGTVAVKVNDAPVKSPAYRDAAVAAGKHYLYSVSAVDVRGNESAHSDEAGENVP